VDRLSEPLLLHQLINPTLHSTYLCPFDAIARNKKNVITLKLRHFVCMKKKAKKNNRNETISLSTRKTRTKHNIIVAKSCESKQDGRNGLRKTQYNAAISGKK
jgi:hypothetical protein